MQRRARERRLQRRGRVRRLPVAYDRHGGELGRCAVPNREADLAESAGRLVVSGAFRTAVGFDVRDLSDRARCCDFIEYCGRTIDAALNEQHQKHDDPRRDESLHVDKLADNGPNNKP